MTLTSGRKVPQMDTIVEPGFVSYPVRANAKFYPGSLVSIDNLGFLGLAGASDGYVVVGVSAREQGGLPEAVFDNTGGANGAFYVGVERGVKFFGNDGSLAGGDTYSVCYVSDEATVKKTGTTKAGFVILVVDGTSNGDNYGAGVWVQIGMPGALV